MKSKSLMGTLIIAFALLTGCTTLKGVGEAISAGLKGTPEVTCTTVAQDGCITLRVLNLQFDEKRPFMRGLDKPSLDEAIRADRVKVLPVEAYKAYASGKAVANGETAYHLYLWNIDKSMPVGKMNAWRLNGEQVTKGVVEDITATVPAPVLDTSSKLGVPDKVFRVVATGDNAGAVSFQAPWSFYTKDSVIMVYSEHTTVYPGPHNGLWITATYLNGTMREGKWKTANLVFLHEKVGKTARQTSANQTPPGKVTTTPSKHTAKKGGKS